MYRILHAGVMTGEEESRQNFLNARTYPGRRAPLARSLQSPRDESLRSGWYAEFLPLSRINVDRIHLR